MINPKTIELATDKSWNDWISFMDSIGAKNLNHHDIALKVFEELDGKIEQAGWWAQSVTVAYEQYIGRRVPGQRADGTFEMSVSKATKLSMKDLMDKWIKFAFEDAQVGELIFGEPS